MIYYIYDNTFEGLLTAIYEAYYRRENPDDIIPKEREEENFLIQRYYIHRRENIKGSLKKSLLCISFRVA